MNTIKKMVTMSVILVIINVFIVFQASAEDIEKTVKYKAPTMSQTIGFIDEMTINPFNFDPGQCMVTTKWAQNRKIFTYRIPLKKINPSPEYVKPSLNCVTLTVDGYEKEIERIESNGDIKMKSKADICSPDRDSAENVAKAVRYLISICGGPPCNDCDPFQWQ